MKKLILALFMLTSLVTLSNEINKTNKFIIAKCDSNDYAIMPINEIKYIKVDTDGEHMTIVISNTFTTYISFSVDGKENIKYVLDQLKELSVINNCKIIEEEL